MNVDEVYKQMARGNSRSWYPFIGLSEVDDSSDKEDEKLLEAKQNDFDFRKKMASKNRRKRR